MSRSSCGWNSKRRPNQKLHLVRRHYGFSWFDVSPAAAPGELGVRPLRWRPGNYTHPSARCTWPVSDRIRSADWHPRGHVAANGARNRDVLRRWKHLLDAAANTLIYRTGGCSLNNTVQKRADTHITCAVFIDLQPLLPKSLFGTPFAAGSG